MVEYDAELIDKIIEIINFRTKLFFGRKILPGRDNEWIVI